ncbi:NAD(+) synthase [Rhizobium sp. L1K21]|uniref:NAD(+) synthase n=1 Tax=Rhizobium sp. L1K21 TaxID=2954933 RepID=UPI002092F622|nr:NAD(+) synthase [Rhizobium sp. L1K21]MCO6187955.1 NAD(+) synthase [Rhizobium sp. L1K21]
MTHTFLNAETFFSLYAQGMARVAVATPLVRLTDPMANAERHIHLASQAGDKGAVLVLFTEMGLTGYSIDDLFHQGALLDATEVALAHLVESSKLLLPVLFVGAPLRVGTGLYNCAIAIHRGRILGVVPKSYLPNYREFYDPRYFTPADGATSLSSIELCGQEVPFGIDLLFEADDCQGLIIAAEICEDAWTPIPPSTRAAMAGANVIVNLSASNATVGKAQFRHSLCEVQSSQCMAAYLYSAAGEGESTTDLAWDGHAMIYENGTLLTQAERFLDRPNMVMADIDLERLTGERIRSGSFQQCGRANPPAKPYRRVKFHLDPPLTDLGLMRPLSRFPYVPSDTARLDELCFEAYNIQVQGLTQRLRSSGMNKIVIGVSGGLDSSHALIVAARAFDRLKLPRKNILAYTLPAFATSDHTKSNAWKLMKALGVSAEEIDIAPAATQMLKDIGHGAAEGEKLYDITFENVQAGARTSILFRLANQNNALVLGTGDLSELALGWCTYGVGDHMSHYNVNASVPKTLIQHLIRWVVAKDLFGNEASKTLESIVDTEISPELVPGDGDTPSQKTEDFVGPYALQDFNLFHTIRYGLRPSKIAFLSWHTWREQSTAPWPPNMRDEKMQSYDLETIRFWLRSFLRRFFLTSQFKRSAVPNGPKISSGGSLSPRGDWRAPSDGTAAAWIAELDRVLPPPGEK